MSANAGSWFYTEPEHNAYLITERLNGTFWQARIIEVYWRCVNPESPFRAEGLTSQGRLELEWVPGQWVSLKVPPPVELDVEDLVRAISTRVLAMPATLSYGDSEGRKVYEWHADGGKRRWSEIQGRPEYQRPVRLKR